MILNRGTHSFSATDEYKKKLHKQKLLFYAYLPKNIEWCFVQ